MVLCRLVSGPWHFERSCGLHLYFLEDKVDIVFPNSEQRSPKDIVSQARRLGTQVYDY